MESKSLAETLRDELAPGMEQLAGLRAFQAEQEQRKLALEGMVSQAKKRAARQPKVQEFLERLQALAHQKSVGIYEELLSALVQDVLPGEKSVALTLQTERGLPALDIEMVKEGGRRESVLEGSGGAIANILSAGLRVIALARSGAYPFLVLDEPDCWLKPSRLPQFANVLGQIAKELGVQVLLISHHDPEYFSGFSAQIRLEKRGGELVAKRTESAEQVSQEWAGVERGIKELRLGAFMSHKSTSLMLGPGVTCLTGENDIGKSAIVAALRALFYGECQDAFIHHGEPSLKVESVFHEGGRLVFEHWAKKSPKRRWQYFVEGSSAAVMDSSPKHGAPDWLAQVARIERSEGLDVALANQKTPVFLLDQPPARRAAILAVGSESSHLQKLIATNKQRAAEDGLLIRNGEKEGALIERRGKEFEKLDTIADELVKLNHTLKTIEKNEQSQARLMDRLAQIKKWSQRQDAAKGVRLVELPMAPKLSATKDLTHRVERLGKLNRIGTVMPPEKSAATPELKVTDSWKAKAKRLSQATQALSVKLPGKANEPPVMAGTENLRRLVLRWRALSRPIPSLAGVGAPARAPEIKSQEHLSASLDYWKSLAEKEAKLKRMQEQRDQKERAVAERLDAAIAESGGQCPTCHGPLSKKHLLGGSHA